MWLPPGPLSIVFQTFPARSVWSTHVPTRVARSILAGVPGTAVAFRWLPSICGGSFGGKSQTVTGDTPWPSPTRQSAMPGHRNPLISLASREALLASIAQLANCLPLCSFPRRRGWLCPHANIARQAGRAMSRIRRARLGDAANRRQAVTGQTKPIVEGLSSAIISDSFFASRGHSEGGSTPADSHLITASTWIAFQR
jgi:hypothetical protein